LLLQDVAFVQEFLALHGGCVVRCILSPIAEQALRMLAAADAVVRLQPGDLVDQLLACIVK
jgi:hypothetical protein